MATLSFSQQKLVIKNDTIISITVLQLKNANKLFVERKMYKNYSDSLFKETEKQKLYISTLKERNFLKTEETELLIDNLYVCDSIGVLKEKRIAILNKSFKKEQNSKIKGFFLGTGIGAVITVAVIILTGGK